MDSEAVPVKRRYDASKRRQHAKATRDRVVEAAERRFARFGYTGTTVATVAADAGVSAETVYKAFGGKAGIVRALYERGLAGIGPVPAPERLDARSARHLDAADVLRHWSQLAVEVAPRAAPIALLARTAAATDAEVAGLVKEMNAQRLERMAHNARWLRKHPGLCPRLKVAEIRDVLFVYTSAELYEALVLDQGWSLRRYGEFLRRGMCGQLLDR